MYTWIILISSLIFPFTYIEEKEVKYQTSSVCYYHDLEIKDQSVLLKMSEYIKKVKDGALPIISILEKGDSSFVYLSATIAANTIRNSPPSYIAIFNDRDVAVYNGKNAIQGECLKVMVGHYRGLLQMDLTNRANKNLPGTEVLYSYDPISVKISLINHKIVSVDDTYVTVGKIPHYKFSF